MYVSELVILFRAQSPMACVNASDWSVVVKSGQALKRDGSTDHCTQDLRRNYACSSALENCLLFGDSC